MKKKVRWLNKEEAEIIGLDPKENDGNRKQNRYPLNSEDWEKILYIRKSANKISQSTREELKKETKVAPKFVLSAWNQETGKMMDIDEHCKHYSLPRKDILKYKLVSHTGTPFFNIEFKDKLVEEIQKFDFDKIIKKHIKPIKVKQTSTNQKKSKDFDSLTYTDVHIGMDTDIDNNTMYQAAWDKKELVKLANLIVEKTIKEQESNILYVDDLGDLLDGLDGYTTRGGHKLPQNMTNEECFDAALDFKMIILQGLVDNYDKIFFNNICNDNHSGIFAYFVNQAFKKIAEVQYENVTVTNHRQFISHYIVNRIGFVISHGKDDKNLKFGFKPHIDLKGVSKIDQYCKHNGLYKDCDLIIFKKGDSHQALFDMCSSSDFFYFNYPASSPSSNWIKSNFELGRRGFVNESFEGLNNYLKPNFIRK